MAHAQIKKDWASLDDLQARFSNEADYYRWFVATYRPDKEKVRYDPRFPNQNSTKKCWVNYLDNLRCRKELGKEASECEKYKRVAEAICPQEWLDEWNEQFRTNTMAGVISTPEVAEKVLD